MFCDSLDCPNYTYSDVLKLHAYYISKKEIKLKDYQRNASRNNDLNSNNDDVQSESNKKDHENSSSTSYDFDTSDSESHFNGNQIETESQKSKKGQKNWSEQEIKCLIISFNKYGNQWQKIIKSNPDTFINKNSANLRNKVNQLKKDPKYSYLFDS